MWRNSIFASSLVKSVERHAPLFLSRFRAYTRRTEREPRDWSPSDHWSLSDRRPAIGMTTVVLTVPGGKGGGAPVPIFLFPPGWQAGASSVFAVLFALRIRLAAGNLFLVCIANDGLTLRRRRAADCVRGGCMHSWSIDMPLCLSSYSCLWKALPHQSEILTLTLFAAHT